MFQWYQNAVVCYVYLADVPGESAMDSTFSESKWFTRGWTLQELIAPRDVFFYNVKWSALGTRESLGPAISSATNIEAEFLRGENLERASIAKKMSWASGRETTRIEDTAYCLIGIFDVNMPLLYGEGKKAFRRLQQEILKMYPLDHTLFAWGTVVDDHSRQVTTVAQLDGSTSIPWDEDKSKQILHGLLADSPSDFASCDKFVPWSMVSQYYRMRIDGKGARPSFPAAIGKGIRLDIPTLRLKNGLHFSAYHWTQPRIVQIRSFIFALFLCGYESSLGPAVLVPLQPWGDSFYGRTRELLVIEGPCLTTDGMAAQTADLIVDDQRQIRAQNGDMIVRRAIFPANTFWEFRYPSSGVRSSLAEALLGMISDEAGKLLAVQVKFLDSKLNLGFAILIERLERPSDHDRNSLRPMALSLRPLWYGTKTKSSGPEPFHHEGLYWDHKFDIFRPDSSEPYARHTMKTPVDVWEVDEEHFLPFSVKVERMALDERGGCVDVVDIVVHSR